MEKIFKKKNIKYYLVYYIILELITGFPISSMIWGIIKLLITLTMNFTNLEVFSKNLLMFVVGILLWLVIVCLQTLPVTIFLLARKSADITQEIQNRKYNSKEEIIYYREKLDGISPTTISLMQNLKVEEEKDFAATLMKLQLNKNINIENNLIEILSDDVSNLTTSEKQLFYIISEQKLNRKQIIDWAELSVKEAMNAGYIEKQNPKKGLGFKKLILFLMLGLFFCILIKVIPQLENCLDRFDSISINNEMEWHDVGQSEHYEIILELFFMVTLSLMSIVGILGWLPFYIVYTIRYMNKNNSLKRTEKGEQLTDIILGMKRFIHDFSMLDTAAKEQIALWDDFLIYAIVLEENEKIIDEILSVKNIKKVDANKIIQ